MTGFDASIIGDELYTAVQLPTCIYSARLALFIHGIMSAKRTREVRPAVLVRESSTQLLIYSLDTGVRHSTSLVPRPLKGLGTRLTLYILTDYDP